MSNRERRQQREQGHRHEHGNHDGGSSAQTFGEDREVDRQGGPTLVLFASPARFHHHLWDHRSVGCGFRACCGGPGTGRRLVGPGLWCSIAPSVGVWGFAAHQIADFEIVVTAPGHAAPADR